jgi:hypothetical protein
MKEIVQNVIDVDTFLKYYLKYLLIKNSKLRANVANLPLWSTTLTYYVLNVPLWVNDFDVLCHKHISYMNGL